MSAEAWQITWFTLGVAALSTLAILPFGVGLGWLLARREWRGKSVVETLIALPLVLPPVATGLILLKLFGRRSLLGGFLEEKLGVEIVFTWKAVVVATAVMSFPLLVSTVRVAFENVSPRLELIARTLGAGPWRVFRTITLPLAARGVAAGAALAFARGLGEFGATIMLAGFIPGKTATLALSIHHLAQLGEDREAMLLIVISVVIAFGSVWISGWFMRRRTP
jgi:molybdate transport system permease protein